MPSPVIWKWKEGCSPLIKNVISQVQFEIGQIDQLFDSYADLLERQGKNDPDLVEITAIAAVLHSFYNGLENIFLSIAKGLDANVPSTAQWHRDLLNQMTNSTATRNPLLTIETSGRLSDYLGFRHFFRHSYSFFMEWEELEKLVTPLHEVWGQAKEEIEKFLTTFDSHAPAD